MRRIIVSIDSLVLKGFRHEDRYAIAAGLQRELSRALAESEAARGLRNLGDVGLIRAGKVNVEQGSAPQHLGAQVAQAVVRGMSR